jgi:DNA-binding response OmpR family regulator
MRKILVAEDDKDLRDMLATFLKAQGYEPVPCADGAQAWARLCSGGAEMAILDVNMPRMTGLELCQRIRTDPALRELPVLMLTVKKEVEDQIEGYETGADDYLSKPFDFPVLIERVRALERRAL